MEKRLWVLIDEYLSYARRDLGLTEKTIYGYNYALLPLVRWGTGRTVDTITIDELNEYFRSEEDRGLCIGSVNTYRRVIKGFFYYCQYYKRLPLLFDYKMIRIKKAQLPAMRFATTKDVNHIVSLLDDYQDKLIVLTLFQTCMRISELVGLRAENINDREIMIVGKGGKKRLVMVSPELSMALEKHMIENHILTGTVFRHRVTKDCLSSKGYTVSGIRNRFIRRLKPHHVYAGFHWYRHGGATEMMRNGAGLRFIQEYLGHADIRTTMIYTHITDTDKRENFDKFFPKAVNVTRLLDNKAHV